MHPIPHMLQGGDRRSIGKSNAVAARVVKEPELMDVLFSGMLMDDPVLRMRCADAAEKVGVLHPEYLAPHKPVLLKALAQAQQAGVRWHVAPMLACLPLSQAEQAMVVKILTGYLNDRSSIVKTFAMQALSDLALRHETLRPAVLRHLKELVVTGTPA